jgi:hypothetical protein
VRQKTVPTCRKFLPVSREKINVQWSKWTLRKVLKEMGFRWKKYGTKRHILIERADTVYWRCRYFCSPFKYFEKEAREIFYLDEIWVDSSLMLKKCWQGYEVNGVMTTSTSHRLMVVHNGSSNGFLEGTGLVFKERSASGNYHGQMNADNFEKWLNEIIIPKLLPASVLVMDNAHHIT